MVVHIISMFISLCLRTLHNLILGCTPYWGNLVCIFPYILALVQGRYGVIHAEVNGIGVGVRVGVDPVIGLLAGLAGVGVTRKGRLEGGGGAEVSKRRWSMDEI